MIANSYIGAAGDKQKFGEFFENTKIWMAGRA